MIHKINKLAELANPAQAERQNASEEQSRVADLAPPGSDYEFSDEFAQLLRVLGGEGDFA